MTNLKHLLAGLCALAACALPVSYANTVADTPDAIVVGAAADGITLSPRRMWAEVEEEEEGGHEENVFRDSIRKVLWLSGKPNRKAKYYIVAKVNRTSYRTYMGRGRWERKTSTSVAPQMAGIAKHYKDMRKDGRVELLFISGDQDKEYFRACLREFKVKCPAAVLNDTDVHSLPGMSELASSYMSAVMVRASDGSIVGRDSPLGLAANWKKIMLEAEDTAEPEAK